MVVPTFAPVSGATSDTLTIASTTLSESGTKYEAVFSNGTGPDAVTTAATLNVNPDTAPVVLTNPLSQVVGYGQSATFTAAASGVPSPTVQWQLSVDRGSTWTNVAGLTSPSFTSGPVTLFENGWETRAVFTNPAGSATTSPATRYGERPRTHDDGPTSWEWRQPDQQHVARRHGPERGGHRLGELRSKRWSGVGPDGWPFGGHQIRMDRGLGHHRRAQWHLPLDERGHRYPGNYGNQSRCERHHQNVPLHTQVLLPSDGATLSGSTVLDASAAGTGAITGVQFVVTGGALSTRVVGVASPTLYGWLVSWDTSSVPNGATPSRASPPKSVAPRFRAPASP